MNIAYISFVLIPCTLLTAYADASNENSYSEEHKAIALELAEQQDELQADTSEIILGETNPKVVELLKKCRVSMNDAINLLENYDTGGKTLAAQSEVIELIYQAAKTKNSSPPGEKQNKPKDGSDAMMDMLRQLLGMDASEMEEQAAEAADAEEGESESQDSQNRQKSGPTSGKGITGESNKANQTEKGVSDPNIATESRSVPKSSGIVPSELPKEFREAIEAYNKTLQK